MISPPMKYSSDGVSLTASFEGCDLVSYKDLGGVWTIGYGHTGPDVGPGQSCTKQQALMWLLQDSQWAADEVNKLVNVPLTQGEFDALVDFVFNLGAGNFASSTLLRQLNAGNYAGAANQFQVWDHVSGQVVAGLLRRRVAEQGEFNA